jgi:hypothetical protein
MRSFSWNFDINTPTGVGTGKNTASAPLTVQQHLISWTVLVLTEEIIFLAATNLSKQEN